MKQMKVLEVGSIELSESNRDWFNRTGYEMTGETLKISSSTGNICSYVVFRGDWTRYDTVRDCGEYWIYAGWSRYYRIDKNTFEITPDVDDM